MSEQVANSKNKKSRKAAGWILLGILLLFAVYCTFLAVSRLTEALPKERGSIFTRFAIELVSFGFLSILAFDLQHGFLTKTKSLLLRCLGWLTRGLLVLFAAALVFFGMAADICGGIDESKDAGKEYVFLLGLALRGGEVTEDLQRRLDRAVEYQKTHPEAFFFMTGGNSEDRTASEAAKMSGYLGSRGFNTEGNIDWDFLAETTVGNFAEAAKTVGTEDPIVIITSDYHMFRASAIARRQGFERIYRVPASSAPLTYAENILWEAICLIFELLSGHLAF